MLDVGPRGETVRGNDLIAKALDDAFERALPSLDAVLREGCVPASHESPANESQSTCDRSHERRTSGGDSGGLGEGKDVARQPVLGNLVHAGGEEEPVNPFVPANGVPGNREGCSKSPGELREREEQIAGIERRWPLLDGGARSERRVGVLGWRVRLGPGSPSVDVQKVAQAPSRTGKPSNHVPNSSFGQMQAPLTQVWPVGHEQVLPHPFDSPHVPVAQVGVQQACR